MNFEEIQSILQEIEENPETLKDIHGELDKVIHQIIKVEKKSLYGVNQISESKRRQEIQELLESYTNLREDNNAS